MGGGSKTEVCLGEGEGGVITLQVIVAEKSFLLVQNGYLYKSMGTHLRSVYIYNSKKRSRNYVHNYVNTLRQKSTRDLKIIFTFLLKKQSRHCVYYYMITLWQESI